MRRKRAKHRKSGLKGAMLMAMALAVLLGYPLGVIWVFLATDTPGVSIWGRLWHALGWPLLTFMSLVDEAQKHLPRPMA